MPEKKEEGFAARTVFFAPEKVTKGAVRFVETTAKGTKKAQNKSHVRTLYLRHEALDSDEDGELVVPELLKVTVEQV